MKTKIGNSLTKLRKLNNYTQRDLAKKLGVKPATIGHWEQNRNEPSYEMLEKLTKLYNISISHLFEDSKCTCSNSGEISPLLILKVIDLLIDEGLLKSKSYVSFDSLDRISQNMLKSAVDQTILHRFDTKKNR